jgi:glycyl-tRNA synthetase (class II)
MGQHPPGRRYRKQAADGVEFSATPGIEKSVAAAVRIRTRGSVADV